MPRDIPVGNGKLLVCFDKNYRIRDLYYPHVGQENHVRAMSSTSGSPQAAVFHGSERTGKRS